MRDLDSDSGTFVNGLPVKDRGLTHGDQLRVGDSRFLVLLQEEEAPEVPSPLQFDEDEPIPGSTVELRREEVLSFRPDKLMEKLLPRDRMARDLNALLTISTAINSIRGLVELEKPLLGMIFEVVPADRGAILLVGKSPEEFTSVVGRDRSRGQDCSVHVNRALMERVLREGIGTLSHEASAGESERPPAKSPGASGRLSILAVPMVVFDKVVGIIYLETRDASRRFDEGHLHLLTAIAGIAAMALDNARQWEWLESENRRLRAEINIEHNMVGDSPAMREVYQFIARVGPTESTVLLRGESGTGKELVAWAIHQNSPRAEKPFVAINCAALTETLLESEMFGHEKGSFTGAIAQKKGKLEVADGGTVLLDEVAELAPTLQAKLLRALQEREFERVGSTRPVQVDIRLIAATNQDLEQGVRRGTFRQDLYYRLNVVSLTIPPLRERREDIPELANYFVAKSSERSKRRILGISPDARACLMSYDWPGNVRELENALERAVVLGSAEFILPEDLPELLLETEKPAGASINRYHEALKEVKKRLILEACGQAKGNLTEAARLLGLHPNYLHRLIRNMGLRTSLKKGDLGN